MKTDQPCWSNPDPPSLSWAELAQSPISQWASYFPDVAPADPHALRFVRDKPGEIDGIYRGRRLQLNFIADKMVITLSSEHFPTRPLTRDEAKFKHLVHFLTSGSGIQLKGEIEIKSYGRVVLYQQASPEEDAGYIKCLFELMSDLADAYPTLIAEGGALMPALLADAIKQNWGLRSLNTQLLKGIVQATIDRYRHQAAQLLCPTCLVRCCALEIDLPWLPDGRLIYYGCRSCGQSKEFWKIGKQITVVLDRSMAWPYDWDRQNIRINWLSHRRLCDFDRVEIIQATDEDVERFVVQLGNETDPGRKERSKHIPCFLSSQCKLSENTRKILAWWFEQIEVIK